MSMTTTHDARSLRPVRLPGLRTLAALGTMLTAGLREVRVRRTAAALGRLDDRMLADIGLHRSEIEPAVRARLQGYPPVGRIG